MNRPDIQDIKIALGGITSGCEIIQSIRKDITAEEEGKFGMLFGSVEYYGSKIENAINQLLREVKI